MRAAWLVVAACGRVDFDPLADALPDAVPLAPCSADPDLVACYAFEGDTLDASQNHNDGMATNAAFTQGVTGLALLADATTRIAVAESASLDLTTAETVDAWIRIDELSAGIRAVIIDHNNGYAVWIDGGDLVCGLFNGVDHADAGTPPITTAVWHHIACTYDTSTLIAWVDGAMAGQTAGIGAIGTPADTVEIAGNAPDVVNPGPDPFMGAIDQLRIWRVVIACAADGTC